VQKIILAQADRTSRTARASARIAIMHDETYLEFDGLLQRRHVIDDASRWIAAQALALRGTSIPLVCNRFDLTILEAIEALKRSHAVTCGR
jgi:hypothetical protein